MNSPLFAHLIYWPAMGKNVLIMLLGTWVALLPFLGFPGSWDRILLVISGVIIISIGIAMRREKGKKFDKKHESLQEAHVEENK